MNLLNLVFAEVAYVVDMSCSGSGNAFENLAMFTAAGRLRNEWKEWEGLDACTDAPLLCAQGMGSHENMSGVY